MTPLASRIQPAIATFFRKGIKPVAKKPLIMPVEALEPRIVPAANVGMGMVAGSLSAAQVDTLVAGLESLDLVLHDVDGSAQFGTFGGLENGAGVLFGLGSADGKGGFLGDALRDQFDAAFPTTATVEDVNAFLQTSPADGTTGAFSGVGYEFLQGGSYDGDHPLEWEFKIGGTRTQTVNAQLDDPTFSTAPTVDVTTTGSVTFSFGLDAAGEFFATLTDAGVRAQGTQTAPTGTIDFGNGKSFNITGGSLAIDSTLGVSIGGSEAADGILTQAELGALHAAGTPSALVATSGPELNATYRLDTATPILLLQKAPQPAGEAAAVSYDMAIGSALATKYRDLFTALETASGELNSNPLYTADLPGLTGSLKDLTQLDEVFQLAQETQDYLTLTGPTVQGLGMAAVEALPANLNASLTTSFDAESETLTFSLAIGSEIIKSQVGFDRFGEAASNLGLSFNRDEVLTFEFGAAYAGSLDFAVDLASSEVSVTPQLELTAGFNADDLNLSATLGPLNAGIVHGSASLATSLTLAGGSLNTAELQNGGALTLAGAGAFDVTLPLDASFGGTSFADARVELSSPNIFTTPVTFSTTTPNFEKLFSLGKISPDDVLDFIVDAGTWAQRFSESPLFQLGIPFTTKTLGDVVDFGTLFAANLKEKLQTSVSFLVPQADFAAFTSSRPINLVIAAESGETTSVQLAAGSYDTIEEYQAALNTALGTSGYRAVDDGTGKVRITTDGEDTFALRGAAADLLKLGFLASLPDLFSEGSAVSQPKLTKDAKFFVSVAGAEPVEITVPVSATSTNRSLADLAADVQTALNAQGISVSVDAGKLKFSQDSGEAFLLAPSTGSAALGITTVLTAGLVEQVGATVKERSFQTLNDLVPVLAEALGVPEGVLDAQLDFSTLTFTFAVDLDYTGPALSLPVGFNFELGDLANIQTVDADGNPSTPTLSITPHLSGHTVFGFTLQGGTSYQELIVTASEGFAPSGYDAAADGGPNPEDARTWNGQLPSDAVLKFSFDDGLETSLTISKNATTSNTSSADLLADVNAAIAGNTTLASKIGARIIAGEGATADRIAFFTKEQTDGFQIRTFQVLASGSADDANGLGLLPNTVMASAQPAVAIVNQTGTTDFSPDSDVVFKISVNGEAERTITVTKAVMASNTGMPDLLADINAAIEADVSLAGQVRAVRIGAGSQFAIMANESARTLRVDPEGGAVSALHFEDEPSNVRSQGANFFLEDTSLSVDATIAVDDFRLAAQLGFIGVTTGAASGSIVLNAKAELKDGDNTRFSIGELFQRAGQGTIGEIVETSFTGTADASLGGLEVDGGLLALTSNGRIEIHSDNIFAAGGPQFTVDIEGLPADTLAKLKNFSSLDWRSIYEGIRAGVDLLSQTEQFSFLKETRIPVLNLSFADAFTFTDQVLATVDELENNPAGVLQAVELQIEQILGLPEDAFSLTLEDGSVVKMHLGIQESFSQAVGLNFNLADIAALTNDAIPVDLLSLGGFLDASSEGSINLSGYAQVSLDLGIDLSGSTLKFIAYQSSGVELGLRAVGQNLNVSVTLGPAGLAIRDGLVLLDSDGLLDGDDADDLQDEDYATIHFGPKQDYVIAEALADLRGGAALGSFFGLTYDGTLTATLPAAVTSALGELDLPSPIELKLPSISGLFNQIKGAVDLKLPSFDGLLPEIPGLIQLLRDPAILLDGVDSGLGLIQSALGGKVATKLPLIGDQLASGSQFIEEFRAGFLSELTAKLRGSGDRLLDTLQETMFDFFSGDLNLLLDYNGDSTVTKDDVVLTFRKADGSIWQEGEDPREQDAVQFNLHLGQSITLGTDLNVDFAVPGLSLDIAASPEITAGWDLFLGFGVSVTDYFYLDAVPAKEFSVDADGQITAGEPAEHELSLGFNAVLTSDPANPLRATGKLFFLQLDADDKLVDGEYSHISGEFFVNLNDPGIGDAADGRATVSELFKRGGEIKPLDAGLEAEAIVNLALTASVGGNTAIPRVLTDFNLEWNFAFGQPVAAPEIGFTNARLDLGSFVTDFLKPIVGQVNDVLEPFDPVIDALQTKIPVLSEFLGRDYTVLDLAVQFGKVDRRFIDSIIDVRELVADIDALPDGVSIEVPIGSLTGLGTALMSKDGAKGVDTSSLGSTPISIPTGSATQNQYRDTFSKATSVTGGGIAFPILKPANAFKLLLGQEATLVTYDIPKLEVGLSLNKSFPIYPPLFGTFSGSVSAYADLAVGFDTKGFNTFKTSGDVVDILDGFFVSDRANADGTGEDVYEAGFKGRIGIGGSLNFAVVEAGIEGFFELSANFDLNDPNDDGKIRGSEIIALVGLPNGVLNLGSIDLKGEIGARAYVDVFAFGWTNVFEYEFIRATIFEEHFAAPVIAPEVGQTMTIGGETVLMLNAGPSANQRDFISTSDVGEEFVITGSGRNINVSFTNTETSQSFTGIDRVILSGGKGNDRLIVGADVTTSFVFDGGEGDDEFQGGAGNDVIVGGTGNDIIRGGLGNNTLDGGEGADEVIGGAGNDLVIGGSGDDKINGGGGADTFQFADDWGRDSLSVSGANLTRSTLSAAGADTGKFDFSQVTKNLTINVSASGANGVSGTNMVSYSGGASYITDILGGSGNDSAIIASSGTGEVTVNGGAGTDQYLVSFGRLNAAVHLEDSSGSGDLVQIAPLAAGFALAVGQHAISGTKTNTTTQNVTFGDGFENLTVDAKSNGGSTARLTEKLSFDGEVRLSVKSAEIEHTISAGGIRLDVTQALTVGANLNATVNGNITAISGGAITLNGNIYSSAGTSFIGDGSGLIQLNTTGSNGSIQTGVNDDGSTPQIIADFGNLLLRGTGAIGTISTPIFTQVAVLAANSSGLINLHEANGVVVSDVVSISGIKTGGGNLTIFNERGEFRSESPIQVGGGDTLVTSDVVQINSDVSSAGGNIVIQPKGVNTLIGIGEGVNGVFDLAQDEVSHLVDGFDQITLGRADGKNLINLGTLAFSDPAVLRNPILGGHVDQSGNVTGTDNATFTILGSGHTTELSNQTVTGTIDIVDSAIVRDGETVTLTSTGGNVFLNFNLDGSAGAAVETLNISSAGETVIKGNIGGTEKLGVLHITNASQVRFEGAARVGQLIIDDGASFVIDGTILADSITISGVESTTFESGITLSGALNVTTTLSATFKGAVQTGSLTIAGGTLADFYQAVSTNVASVKAEGASGDLNFRQGFNFTTGTLTAADDATLVGAVSGTTLTLNAGDAAAFQSSTLVSNKLDVTATSIFFANGGVLEGGEVTLTTTNAATGDVRLTGNVDVTKLTVQTPRAVVFQEGVIAGTLIVEAASLTLDSLEVATSFNATGSGFLTARLLKGGALSANMGGAINVNEVAGNSVNLTGATITTGAGGVQSDGALTLTGTAGGVNSLTLNGLVDGETVTLTASKGILGNAPINAAALTVTGTTLNFLAPITTSAGADFNATALSLTAGIQTGQNLGITATTAALGESSVGSANITVTDRVTFNGAFTSTGALLATALGTGTSQGIVANSPLTGNGITLQSVRGISTQALNGGAINVSGAGVNIAGQTTGTALSITSTGTLTTADLQANTATLQSTGAAVFGAATIAGTLAVDRASSARFTGAVDAKTLNVGLAQLPGSLQLDSTLDVALADLRATGTIALQGTTTAGSFFTNAGTRTTFAGAFSADNLTVRGGSFESRANLAVNEQALFANAGDVTVDGSTQAATLRFTGVDDVTLNEGVNVTTLAFTGGSFLAESTLDAALGTFDALRDLRVVGAANFGALTITKAVNTTFQGALHVDAALTANGSGATRFEGVTDASTIAVDAEQQIFAGSTLRVNGAGALNLRSLEIDFVGGSGSVQGSGPLNLRPYNANTSVDLGSPVPTGTLDLSDQDLNALSDGFSTITIGRADSTAQIVMGSALFKDNLVLLSRDLLLESNTSAGEEVRVLGNLLVEASGSVVTNEDLFASAITFNVQNNATFHGTVNGTTAAINAGLSGTGDLLADAALNFTGPATLTAGATAGHILFSSDLRATTLGLTATAGEITQTSGLTTAADITALARDGVRLLTHTDHISARVTGPGDIFIIDNNAAPHVLVLGGSAPDDGLFTADGDITVEALGNIRADRVAANGALNLSGNEVVVNNASGTSTTSTGTTVLDQDQITQGEPIIFNGNVRLLRDLIFDSNGGNITVTGRVLSLDGTQGLNIFADGGNVLVGGGDVEFLEVADAQSFTLNGPLHTVGDFGVEADAIALNAPARSITTTTGALHLQPRGDTAIEIGREGAGFSLNDAELRALGNGFSEVEIGRVDGDHIVNIESAIFVDDVTIHADRITLLASSTAQGVNGISAVNGAEKNHLLFLAQSAFTQGKRAGISTGGNVTIVADTMALDTFAANSIRGFGTLDLHANSAGVAVTLGDTIDNGGLNLTARELKTVNSTFSTLQIGSADTGLFRIAGSLNLQNNTNLVSGADMEVTGGVGKALTLQNVRGRDISLTAAGNVAIQGSLQTSGNGDIAVRADSDADGAGALTWGLTPSKAQVVQKAVTELGDVTLSGASVQLGGSPLPKKTKSANWSFQSVSGDLFVAATTAVTFDNATTKTTGDFSIAADTSAITGGKLKASDLLVAALSQNSLTSATIKALATATFRADPASGVVTFDSQTNIRAVASILVESAQFARNDAS